MPHAGNAAVAVENAPKGRKSQDFRASAVQYDTAGNRDEKAGNPASRGRELDRRALRYGSVCSGIEAATVAWDALGWQPVFFSEIEPFPCALLAHHYPDVPNYGDMTRFQEWPDACICRELPRNHGGNGRDSYDDKRVLANAERGRNDAREYSNGRQNCERCGGAIIDVLVGGTPCQSFSVAGLRAGLADPRGNLMLTFLAIAQRYRPEWVVWENVPGVLSSNGGRDFASFLHGLGDCGYGWAYRVLDAQYFGLAQRRKRVFVVGSTRGWAAAAAVLFESASLQGHPAPRREARQGFASRTTHSLRADGFDASEDGTGRGIPLTVGTLSNGAHNGGGLNGQDAYSGRIIPVPECRRHGAAGLRDRDAGGDA